MSEVPVRVLGRYALYREIAAGGMATVHLGRLLGPVGFSRTVAIKRLHPQYAKDPEFVSMFLDEARLVSRIQHPNVIPTLDVVSAEGELFLVMEYVEGESLARLTKYMKAKGELIPRKILGSIITNVLYGLHAAHEAKNERGQPLGIIHRDVSPQNVLIGIDGAARVLDFGVARAMGRVQTTRDGQLKGKVSYMPVEQLTGQAVDRRVDVYAASVVLWEALTGRRMFDGENESIVLYQATNLAPAPPSQVVPNVSPALDAVVMKGLARDPGARWATAYDMAVALEETLGTETPRRVAELLVACAGEDLAKRSASVKEMESQSGSLTVSHGGGIGQSGADSSVSKVGSLSMNAARPVPGGRFRALFVLAAAVTGVGLGAAVFAGTSGTFPGLTTPAQPGAPSASAPASNAPAKSSAGTASPSTASPEPVASGAPPSASASSAPSAGPPPTSKPPPVAVPAVPRPPRPPKNCSPPYTMVDGVKKFKPECM